MKAGSKHYFLLLLGALTVVVTAIGYWYFYNSIISQAEERMQLAQEVKNSEQNNKQEIKLLETSSSTEIDRQKLLTYFVSNDKILDFIKSIEGVAGDSATEVTLSGISTEDLSKKKDEDIGHITVHALVKGSWSNVNKALILIENLPYNISLKSVSLNTSSSGDLAVSDGRKTSKPLTTVWNLSLDISALTMK